MSQPVLMSQSKLPQILGVPITPTCYDQVTEWVLDWAGQRASRMVCFANVHMVMLAQDDPDFKAVLNHAHLVTPDGMPLVWTLRRMGFKSQQRVHGPTFTRFVLPHLEASGVRVGFLGSTSQVLDELLARVRSQFPHLDVVFATSPPFRDLTEAEDRDLVEQINASGAAVLFIGLGCPKQERWMQQHLGKVHAVMLGVGVAFDYLSEMKTEAPGWMQGLGLEWCFRLFTEPRRLWQRYVYYNPRFVLALIKQFISQ